MRLFAAIALSPDLAHRIAALQGGLKNARWVAPENLHLTLRFIGEVEPPTLDALDLEFSRLRADPFAVTLQGLGTFGRPPSTVWLGAESAPPDALPALHDRVEGLCQRAGLAPSGRKFTPHVTLARLKRGSSAALAAYMETQGAISLDAMPVKAVTLFESHLRPSGAQYHAVRTYPLHDDA